MGLGAVLFDLDDTLVDRTACFAAWTVRFSVRHQMPEGAVDTIIQLDERGHRSREELFERITDAFDLYESPRELLDDYYDEFPSSFVVDPVVVSGLRALRAAGAALAVVTNGPPTQRTKLQVTGLLDEVDAVCVSSEVGTTKPDPAIFLEALRRIDRGPENGWMVGDAPIADISGGRSVGLNTAWISGERTWPEGSFAPDRVVASVSEFSAWLLEVST
jgi:HAD superfamily hydrolase (TIGR01509 family)